MSSTAAVAALSPEALASWSANADFWNEGIGREGNKYWKILQEPCLSRLLYDHLARPGCRALDLATGNGLCARWLAGKGASVTAGDGSTRMLEIARSRSADVTAITFRELDVTNPDHFDACIKDCVDKHGAFDIVLINMAVMDVATLDPLAAALPRLLKKDGAFVATVLHPAFMTSDHSRIVDVKTDPETGEQGITRSKAIRKYMNVPTTKGIALYGQPVKQLYFHRPIHELFGIFFKQGLVMDALEEPTFTEESQAQDRLESTANYVELPVHMAFRLRRAV